MVRVLAFMTGPGLPGRSSMDDVRCMFQPYEAQLALASFLGSFFLSTLFLPRQSTPEGKRWSMA